MRGRTLIPELLTREAFAPFGEVIETEGAETRVINKGFAIRRHALAHADVGEDGQAVVSIFEAKRRPFPLVVDMMERHPLASQAFYPLSPHDWLVVVCEGDGAPDPQTLRCFRATGRQGVNYAANIWHFPVLILAERQDFLVVDRDGPDVNLEEQDFSPADIASILLD